MTIEWLEKRELLSVSLTFDATAANLFPGTTSPVPIINATVNLQYTNSNGVVENPTSNTNSSGACTFVLNDLNVGQSLTSVTFMAQGQFYNAVSPGSKPGGIMDTGHLVNYEIDQCTTTLDNKPLPQGPYTYTLRNVAVSEVFQTTALTVNAQQLPDGYETASAFAILSALYSPLVYADSLRAALPNKFAVDYPNDTYTTPYVASYFSSSGASSGQTVPTLNYTWNVVRHPITIGHEFGHMVAWQNGFASEGGEGHWLAENIRGTSLTASEGNLQTAFSEGWADYFAVCARDEFSTLNLNIPGLDPTDGNGNPNTMLVGRYDIAKYQGVGEDNELSVAEMFWQLAQVGINANGQDKNEATVAPLGKSGLFQILQDSNIQDLAQFYSTLNTLQELLPAGTPENEYFATLGALSQCVGVSAAPGTPAVNIGGLTFSFTVPTLTNPPANPSLPASTTTFQYNQIQVEVFTQNWTPLCIFCFDPPFDNPDPLYDASAISVASGAGRSPGQGSVRIGPKAWDQIYKQQAYYWVVEAQSCPSGTPRASPVFFWSQAVHLTVPPIPDQGKPVSATEGESFTEPVARIQGLDGLAGLTAEVSFGDNSPAVTIDNTQGTAQNGSIVFDASSDTATVDATHDYAEVGDFAVRTTFYLDGEELDLVDSPATVGPAALSVSMCTGLQFTEGSPATNLMLATFADDGGDQATTNYAATINWGDGTTTPGKVIPQVVSGFGVWTKGQHAYTDVQSHTLTVTVFDEQGATATASLAVAAAPLPGCGAGDNITRRVATRLAGSWRRFLHPPASPIPTCFRPPSPCLAARRLPALSPPGRFQGNSTSIVQRSPFPTAAITMGRYRQPSRRPASSF